MTKPILLFFLSMISTTPSSAFRPNPSIAATSLLVRYISLECGIDSSVVARTINRLHRLYGIKKVRFERSPTNANYYFPGMIRMNIADSNRMCEMWIAELSHAFQFCTNPVKMGLMTARDGIKTFIRMFSLTKSEQRDARKLRARCGWFKAAFWTAWQRTYREPGSLEFDAHQIIEKALAAEVTMTFHGPH